MTQLAGFVREHSDFIAAKGQDPANFIAPLEAGAAKLVRIQGTLNDLKSALSQTAAESRIEGPKEYQTFSNLVTMLIGIFGRGTPKAQQLTKLRKQITDTTRARVRRPRRATAEKSAGA